MNPRVSRGFYFFYLWCINTLTGKRILQGKGVASSDEIKKVILFQLRRNIVVFYKSYLSILEDIGKDHSIMRKRIEEHLPEEFLDNVDYLNQEKYNYIRKKILDGGNEVYRELESSLRLLNFSIKNQNERE